MKKKTKEDQNWFRRHWILTVIGVIFLFIIIGNFSESNKINENTSTIGLWDKEANYTLKECHQVCEEAMPTTIQETVCISACDNIGKQGDTLDKVVNMYKEIILEEKNT